MKNNIIKYISKYKIYGLFDPRLPIEDENCRYIGVIYNKTLSLENRLKQHIYLFKKKSKENPTKYTENYYTARWVRKLLRERVKPKIILLETNNKNWTWQQEEQFMIAAYWDLGAKLTNGTKGGEGVVGYKHTLEQNKKNSERNKRENQSIELLELRSKNTKNLWNTKEYRDKLVKAHTGKKHSVETIEKMKKSQKRRIVKEKELGIVRFHSKITKKKISKKTKEILKLPEIREKMRKAKLGKKDSKKTKRRKSEAQTKRWEKLGKVENNA
jgi:hypothetical protein